MRPIWLPAAVLARLPAVLASRSSDVVVFQRELISTLITLEPLFKRPRVFDVDDAIHVSQRAGCIERIARSCDMVICGNGYLADRFSSWNKRVRILPTGLDTDYYVPAPAGTTAEAPCIGWIGTSSNLDYLRSIETALRRVLDERRDVSLTVVCDRPPAFRAIGPDRVRFVQWSAERELSAIQSFTVGIMPLQDSAWARGKCSFKLLQYYACGLPAVASPVGMNRQVLDQADAGLAAVTDDDWVDALLRLLDSPQEARRRGQEGRRLVENEYSVAAIVPRMASFLREAAGA